MTAAQVIRSGGMRRNFVLLLLACLATFAGVIVAFKGDATAARAQPLAEHVQMALPPVPPAPGMAPTSIPSAPARRFADARELSGESSDAADPDVRAAAIRELDPAVPDAFTALEQTVRNDPIARNRLLAVNAMRLMAKGGRNVDQVRAVLQAAMADADLNVATSARDAYQEFAP